MRLTKLAGAVMALLLAGTSAPLAGGAADPEKPVKPEWAGNRLGYEALSPDYIDVDYGPMSVSGRTAMSLFKKMTLAKSGLPQAISVRDIQILSGPAQLILENERGLLTYKAEDCQLRSTGKSAAEGLSRFDAGDVTVEIKSQFEFDFTVRYLITLAPKPGTVPVLTRMTLLFPMNLQDEQLCHYRTESPNKGESGQEAQARRIFKDIKVGDREIISPGFGSIFWVGNSHHGLSWNFESAREWQAVKGSEMQYDPVARRMALNFINRNTRLEKPVTYKFFLTPTPLKNMPKNWRTWNYDWRGGVQQKFDRKLVNQLIYWSSIWRAGAYNIHWVRNPEELKKVAQEDAGMNKANYIVPQLNTWQMTWKREDGSFYVLEDRYLKALCEKYYRSPGGKGQSIDIPANALYFKDLAERNRVLGPESDAKAGLKSKGVSIDVVMAAPELADHMVWGVNKFVNEYGVGGIYYDGGGPTTNYSDWSAWSDTYGGWTDPDGDWRPSWHYDWQRDLFKRIRYIVKKANPGEMVTAHQSGSKPISTLALCDIVIPGETLFYGYQDTEKRDASANGDFYYAHIIGDIDNARTEFFHRQWGLPHVLIPELRGKDSRVFPNSRKGTRTMLAYFLHFDMLFWPNSCHTEEIYNWYRIRNAYGMADSSEVTLEFIPYWENKTFRPDDGHVKVSYYDKVIQQELYTSYDIRKRYLVIVSNLQFGAADFTVALPAKMEKIRIRDVQRNKDVFSVQGKLPCSLEPYDFAIFEITGELDEGKGTW